MSQDKDDSNYADRARARQLARRSAKDAKRRGIRVRPVVGPATRLTIRGVPVVPSTRKVLVSVLMSAYGTERFLPSAVRSVLDAKLPPGAKVELLIGVDADPKCFEAARRFAKDHRVRVVRFGSNAGTYSVLNGLFQRSRGEYVAVLDSDDLAKRDRWATQLGAFQADPMLEFCASLYESEDTVTGERQRGPGRPVDPAASLMEMRRLSEPLHSTWMVKRQLFQRLGGYKTWRCGADTDFVLRAIAAKARMRTIPKALVVHRMHPKQLTSTSNKRYGPGSDARAEAQRRVRKTISAILDRTAVISTKAPLRSHDVAEVLGDEVRVAGVLRTHADNARHARTVVDSALRGVDLLRVSLVGYEKEPSWARHPKIEARLVSEDSELLPWIDPPAAKFLLGFDDAVAYPENYVARVVGHLAHVGPGSAVSFRGTPRLSDPRWVALDEASGRYEAAACLDLSTLAIHGADLRTLDLDGHRDQPGACVWLAAACAQVGIKLYRAPAARGWVKARPGTGAPADAAVWGDWVRAARDHFGDWPDTPAYESLAAPAPIIRTTRAASDAQLAKVMRAAPPSSWAIGAGLARHLYRECERTTPARILDVGSGMSTLVLALYASRHGAKLVSLEHDREWFLRTKGALEKVGLADHCRLLHRPMATRPELGGYTWYSFDPEAVFAHNQIDLLFIDGPPEALGHGRDGAVLRCLGNIGQGTRVLLHDGSRPGERAAVRRWEKHVLMVKKLATEHDARGVWDLEVKSVR